MDNRTWIIIFILLMLFLVSLYNFSRVYAENIYLRSKLGRTAKNGYEVKLLRLLKLYFADKWLKEGEY